MEKPQLRTEILTKLRTLDGQAKTDASEAIRRNLAAHPDYRDARMVAIFDAMPSEPALWEGLLGGAGRPGEKTLCFPLCGDPDSTLRFYAVETESQLRPSPRGAFREPDPSACREVAPGELDLVVVPGLAFTPDGATRLGRGGGFYDRFLADPELRAKRIGVCFALQLREDLPREAHDASVDLVITEETSER